MTNTLNINEFEQLMLDKFDRDRITGLYPAGDVRASKSTPFSLNGVMSATPEPVNTVFFIAIFPFPYLLCCWIYFSAI